MSNRAQHEGMRFGVRLTPRATRDEIRGVVDGILVAGVTAPPVEDAANRALERLIARELRLPPSAVRVLAGARNRQKSVVVDGSAAVLASRWPDLITS